MCVFLSLENTGGASFVDVEWDGQSVISICWGQSGRILVLSIAGIFGAVTKVFSCNIGGFHVTSSPPCW